MGAVEFFVAEEPALVGVGRGAVHRHAERVVVADLMYGDRQMIHTAKGVVDGRDLGNI